MIDPSSVPIIYSDGLIDPPGVPVKPLFQNQLTRRAYTFLELPIYLLFLLITKRGESKSLAVYDRKPVAPSSHGQSAKLTGVGAP